MNNSTEWTNTRFLNIISRMMPQVKDHPQWYGHCWNTIPGVDYILWDLVDAHNFTWDVNSMQVTRNWMIMCFHTPGQARVKSTSAPWQVMNNTVVHLYPPLTPYWQKEDPKESFSRRTWINLSISEESPLTGMSHNDSGFVRILDPEHTVADFILEMSELAHEQENSAYWMLQDMCMRLCRTLALAEREKPGLFRIAPLTLAQVRNPLVSKVFKFISLHVKEGFSMRELAEHTKASVTTLTEHFRQSTGETPLHALRQVRLTKARAMIGIGLPLSVVAEETGFSDAFHLSREFKRVHGVSPSVFRDKHTKSDANRPGR